MSSNLITLLLASLLAWCLLRARGSQALAFAGAIIIVYGCLLVATLAFANLVLPLALPLSAAALVFVGTTFWSHLTASQRMGLLERDMLQVQQEAAAVREALVLRENRAEALQEDLDAARAAVAQSTGRQEDLSRTAETLRTELIEVQAQEEAARQKLDDLGRELAGLRAVAGSSTKLGDAELEQLRDECRRLGIITQNHQLLGLFRDLKKGAKSQLPALLLGEPGTGKELCRARDPSAESEIRQALHRRQHGGHLTGAVRERTVRPCARQFHRRHDRSARVLRTGASRDALPR